MTIRITAGILRNRRINVPKHRLVRPTSERVREALFSMIQGELQGSTFLDGCAGSGIMGLEALSRGASHVTLCEQVTRSFRVLQTSVSMLNLEQDSRLELLRSSTHRIGERCWDIAFFDPPYQENPEGWLNTAARLSRHLFLYEHHRNVALPPEVSDFFLSDQRSYGDTKISFYRHLEQQA